MSTTPLYNERQTKRRAIELAPKMRINVNQTTVNSFKIEEINGVPVKINGISVPENLYTEQEKNAIGLAIQQGETSQETITNVGSSEVRSAQQVTGVGNYVEPKFSPPQVTFDTSNVSDDIRQLVQQNRPKITTATFKNQDNRVRLEVPLLYLTGPAAGPSIGNGEKVDQKGVLYLNKGIIFPYTPKIDVSHSASYKKSNLVHTNYSLNFYSGSDVSEITISAKFTVQNSFEAQVLLAVQHLGRALTKMAFGNDQYPIAGSPPPVCRLYAYGEYMLDRTPVVVTNFSMAYPDDVNYFTVEENTVYGVTSVPMVTTVNMTLRPMYSRNEMLNASLNGWLVGGQRSQGYL